MDNQIVVAVAIVVASVLAPLIWILLARREGRRIVASAHKERERLTEEARRESESKRREAEIAARETMLETRSELEAEGAKKRSELEQRERQLAGRESESEEMVRRLERESEQLAERRTQLDGEQQSLASDREALRELTEEQRRRLEKAAGLTAQQAKDELVTSLEEEARIDAANLVKKLEDEAREKAHREAQRIISMAIERSASDYVNETTVSVVMLPNDDMKGRIIGREGRNIRAIEMATGVDLIVDDTPEAVILSGFDPYRREIARVTLERLVSDGRIHPARIEEVADKVKSEFDTKVLQEGEAALLELSLTAVHAELVKLLGRLRFRTSYGQNALQHSKEVAYIAASMAGELKADVHVAKRAGLFHDIGKAVDREMEGTHLELGIELLRKYGETEEVVHAMACHHGDYDPETVEAVLVTASDALSAARPGARREILETYMRRLEKLEEIANDFDGVQKTYAIQAGREIRVIVNCEEVNDEKATWLSRDIAKRIESELTYPGQIKVTVIRESRSVDYAR
ncbi:MAG: ribonuclease Y [Acidobacteriota bacterium]